MSRLHYDPSDLELLEETTPEGFVAWFIERCGGIDSLPESLIEKLHHPETELAPLLDPMMPGDTLWLARSRVIAPLWGHEGIALVRDGRPIVYLRVMNY